MTRLDGPGVSETGQLQRQGEGGKSNQETSGETPKIETMKEPERVKRWKKKIRPVRKYILALVPTLIVWGGIAVWGSLSAGDTGTAQTGVTSLFWVCVATIWLSWVTKGYQETTWKDVVTVMIWSVGAYVISGIVVIGVGFLAAVLIVNAGVPSTLMIGTGVLLGTWMFYRLIRIWSTKIHWWAKDYHIRGSWVVLKWWWEGEERGENPWRNEERKRADKKGEESN